MPESAITRLPDMIHAALVEETAPWPLESVDLGYYDELMEAFAGIGHPFDIIYTLLDHDFISTAEVDRLAHDDVQLAAFRPLIKRAYIDAGAQGRVPGRLN